MKKEKLTLFLVLLVVIFGVSCTQPSPPPDKDYVSFKMKDVIIGGLGNFKLSSDQTISAINLFEFSLKNGTNNPFKPYVFILSELVTLNENTNQLVLEKLDKTKVYTYPVDGNQKNVNKDTLEINGTVDDVLSFNFYDFYTTRFLKKTEFDVLYGFDGYELFSYPWGIDQHSYTDFIPYPSLVLKTNTTSDIILKYDFSNPAGLNLNIDFSREGAEEYKLMHNANMLFNYNVKCNRIKSTGFELDNNNINIVFMADGYNADQISSFNSTVQGAFYDKMVNSNLLGKHWSNTNIITMNTISFNDKDNEDSYHIFGINQYNHTPDKNHIIKILQTSFIGSPVFFEDNGNTNIDVIVIVTKKNYGYYISTNSYDFGNKENKPVRVIIIPAPGTLYGSYLIEYLELALPWLQ